MTNTIWYIEDWVTILLTTAVHPLPSVRKPTVDLSRLGVYRVDSIQVKKVAWVSTLSY